SKQSGLECEGAGARAARLGGVGELQVRRGATVPDRTRRGTGRAAGPTGLSAAPTGLSAAGSVLSAIWHAACIAVRRVPDTSIVKEDIATQSVTTDWGTALMTSVASALALFLAASPRAIGFLIAGALAAVVARLLRAVRFNELASRAGLSGFVQSMGVQTDAAGFLAGIAKWFVRLIVLVVAFDALGLPAVSQIFQQFLLW